MISPRNRTTISAQGDTEIRIERVFNAPRALVWEIYTDAALMPQWLGPRDLVMTIDHMDIRTGGSYRYTHTDPAGNAYVFFGDIREVAPMTHIVQTFNFEGMPGIESVERAEFEDLGDGRTRVVVVSQFPFKEARDGMLQSGMERGVNDTHERIEEILEARLAKA